MRVWLAGLGLAVSALGCMSPGNDRSGSTDGTCLRTGCSHQLCSDHEIITPCLWYPEYACYRHAICDRQEDGACGWTATPELTACLASP